MTGQAGPGVALVLAAALLGGASGARAAPPPEPACVAGYYRGSATEIAAELVLYQSGRFGYALTYGAIDETSSGQWQVKDGKVVLTSDPVTAPRFEFLGDDESGDGQFRVDLELPEDISRQYFDGQIEFADGSFADRQFSDEGLEMDLSDHADPASFRLMLPIFVLRSDWQPLPHGKASHLRFRFEPNDIGKVAFEGTALPMDKGALVLSRYDRELGLSRQGGDCQTP